MNKIAAINSGDVTHHHDQDMTPTSFSMRNTMNTSVGKYTPGDVLESSFFISIV